MIVFKRKNKDKKSRPDVQLIVSSLLNSIFFMPSG